MKLYFLLVFGSGFLVACQPELGSSAATGGAANADGGASPATFSSSSGGGGGEPSSGGTVGEGGIANTTWKFGGFGGGGESNLGGAVNDVLPPLCTPGSTKSCVCPGARIGEQTCNSTGNGFDVCVCDPLCGNWWLEAGEACDDGNLVDGDGCQADCQLPG